MDDTTDIARLSVERLFEQLSQAPVVTVTGVVSAGGASGAWLRGDELWTLLIRFDEWRTEGAVLQLSELTVRRRMSRDEVYRYRSIIEPYSVMTLRARVVTESTFGSPQALLEEIVRLSDPDPELNARAEQLQQPVTCQDRVLGTLTLDRRLKWFTAGVLWNGTPVKLGLEAASAPELPPVLKNAHALWRNRKAWDQRGREFAVRELLPVKNDAWLDEEEDPVSPEEFRSRMTLEWVTVHRDGAFELRYDDGDLFAGHCIEVSGTLTEGPTHAVLMG